MDEDAPLASFDQEFTSFVVAQSTALFRSAFLLTGNRTDAEDLLQDTLSHLYPRWHLVLAADSAVGYVFRSMSNRFISRHRSLASRELPSAELPDTGGPSVGQALLDRDEVWRLLQTLPAKQRAALVLRYFHDLTDAEIARSIGCQPVTVRSLVSRGLASLRASRDADAAGVSMTSGGNR